MINNLLRRIVSFNSPSNSPLPIGFLIQRSIDENAKNWKKEKSVAPLKRRPNPFIFFFLFYDCHLSRSRVRRLGPLHLDFTAFPLEMMVGKQWEYRFARSAISTTGESSGYTGDWGGLVDFSRVLSPSLRGQLSRRYDSRFCYLRAIVWRDDWNLFSKSIF